MEKRVLKGVIATVVLALSMSYGVSEKDNAEVSVQGASGGCINKPGRNNGDCTTDGMNYFCEDSWIFHDCVKKGKNEEEQEGEIQE